MACIRQRVYEEIVDRYGFRYECTQAKAQTMRDVLHEINKRFIKIVSINLVVLYQSYTVYNIYRYGSISDYLLTTNFTRDEQDKVKGVLLEA